MTSAEPIPPMPSFGTLAASLRRTTERFARELARPSVEPPDWSELDWDVARATASIQGIAVLLARQLQWAGPSGWRDFLDEQVRQSLLRDELIAEQLRLIGKGLRHAGIGATALKGSALRRLGLYAPGERPMGDIDLLAQPCDVAAIESALAELDYVRAYTMRRHIVFEPAGKPESWTFGEHVHNPLKVELHTRIGEPLPVTMIDITSELIVGEAPPGLNAYASPGALLLHLLLHSAGGIRAHVLRQIQLNDIARLAPLLADDDWRLVLNPHAAGRPRWWVYAPLALADRYYPDCIPHHVVRAARRACPFWLRTATDRIDLTTVSWSNLRIHALPGIAWSRTPIEALRFIRSRVLPDRTALAELQLALINQPQMRRIPWYGESHGRRILRWVVSRPPRVQTMLSVAAALGQARGLR